MGQDEAMESHEKDMQRHEETLRALDALDEVDKLIEVWKVLEALTVSLDRMGTYWLFHGEEAAKEALHQYIGPAMNERIASARYLMVGILESHDPDVMERLEALAENENDIGYWEGPSK